MSDIVINRAHSMNPADIRALAENLTKSLCAKHGGHYEWLDDHCVCYYHSASTEARVEFDEYELRIRVRLGLMLRLVKPLIEGEIKRYLDENLA